MSELYIYSNEPLVEEVYTTPIDMSNGQTLKLTNIKRNNKYNKIYLKLIANNKIRVSVYRGYYDKAKNIQYSLSNSIIYDGTGTSETLYFQDNTQVKQNFINYYMVIEALENVSFTIQEMGLFFDDIKGLVGFSESYQGATNLDINSDILDKQDYTKIVQFTLVTLRQQIGEIVNVVEKPYYLVHKENCVDNSTIKLSLQSISTNYINDAIQWVNVVLANIEDT